MYSHKLHRDGASIDDGIHAIPHGLDAIIAISSIRALLLPLQSCHYVQPIEKNATPTKAVQSPTPISIEFAMSTGRESRIHTRWPSDALIAAHQRCYAFAIALPHSIFHTQQYSIHRFAESCHGSNLHSTSLHPTSNYIDMYYNLHTHQGCLESHFHSASPTCRFNTTSLHPHCHLFIIATFPPFTFIHFSLLFSFWAWAWARGWAERDISIILTI